MSSKSRNFRRRSSSTDPQESADDPVLTPTTSSSRPQSQTLKSTTTSTPSSRLSFADDEFDAEDSRERPFPPSSHRQFAAAHVPSSAHKHTASKSRGSASKPETLSNLRPQSGEYTKERLLELQKSTRTVGGKPVPIFDSKPKPKTEPHKSEPVVVLRGLIRPPQSQPAQESADHNGTKTESEEDEEEPLSIPDAETIKKIRAKRQQLQNPRHAAPDYISLDTGGTLSTRASAGAATTLSSDEEENEMRGRVAMFSSKKGGTNGHFSADVVDNEEDEDEEERRWEEEQFRKGLGIRRLDDVPVRPTTVPAHSVQHAAYPSAAFALNPAVNGDVFVTRSAEVLSLAQQAEIAEKALLESINKLRETNKSTLSNLVRTETHLTEDLLEISSLKNSMEATGKKYVYMQELKEYIGVIADFLHEKAFYIEELEEQMQKLHERRALAVLERRESDFADESKEMDAAVGAATSVLGKGSRADSIAAAMSAARQAADAVRGCTDMPPELDEFGRDLNLQKQMEFTRRGERRKRRKARAEAKRISLLGKGNASKLVEGEVSTDESNDESNAYESSRNELLQAAVDVFGDAAEEYANLKIVKERFEQWKTQYPSTYRDAYASLSAPQIFAPYVRLELLKWDPLFEKTDFFDMEWHRLLFDYGIAKKESDENDDGDVDLIPVLVEKVALPILHHEIAHCWDILSTRKTTNAVFATEMIVNYVPSSSKALHEMLAIVHKRLSDAVAYLSVPTWRAAVTNAVPGAAQFAAYRFGVSIRLLKSICLWKNVLAKQALEKIALEELLKGKLLPYVKSVLSNIHDAITRTERIVAALSGVWSGPDAAAGSGQELRPLMSVLADIGNKLRERYEAGLSDEEIHGLARRLKNMLVALNHYDKAREILRTFKLKEAL